MPSRIGPGYVPRLLGLLLAGIGLFLVVRSWWTIEAVDPAIAWRPLLFILAAVVAFALVFEATGLVPAILVSVAIANFATPENRWTHGDGARRDARLVRLGAVRQGPVAAAAGLVEVTVDVGDLLQNLAFGFGVAVTPQNLLFCLIGALLGTLVGVLPGLGPVATIAMLLPITFTLPPVAALIMLAGLYYGAQYGGSTTAILVNIPGESSSVVTTLDGHAMARKGRAGSALAIAALGSFFAGCVATAVVAVFSGPLVRGGRQLPLARLFRPAGVRHGRRRGAGAGLGGALGRHGGARAVLWAWSAPTSPPARPASRSASRRSPTASASCRWRWACSASPR